jgi:hypothetical protein
MSTPAPKWMSADAENVLHEARKLPELDRLRLADELGASVTDAVAAEWDEEILQRAEAFESGQLKTVGAKEVFARIDAKYGRLMLARAEFAELPEVELNAAVDYHQGRCERRCSVCA